MKKELNMRRRKEYLEAIRYHTFLINIYHDFRIRECDKPYYRLKLKETEERMGMISERLYEKDM